MNVTNIFNTWKENPHKSLFSIIETNDCEISYLSSLFTKIFLEYIVPGTTDSDLQDIKCLLNKSVLVGNLNLSKVENFKSIAQVATQLDFIDSKFLDNFIKNLNHSISRPGCTKCVINALCLKYLQALKNTVGDDKFKIIEETHRQNLTNHKYLNLSLIDIVRVIPKKYYRVFPKELDSLIGLGFKDTYINYVPTIVSSPIWINAQKAGYSFSKYLEYILKLNALQNDNTLLYELSKITNLEDSGDFDWL